MITKLSGRIFVYRNPTDMRSSFKKLTFLVREAMKEKPSGGDYFLFLNKPKTHLKILYFDRTGFVIWYKRLEQGTFTHPEKREISGVELMCLLEGVEVIKSKQNC